MKPNLLLVLPILLIPYSFFPQEYSSTHYDVKDGLPDIWQSNSGIIQKHHNDQDYIS